MKKIRKKKAQYREPDAELIDFVKWLMNSFLFYGQGVRAEIYVYRRFITHVPHVVMSVTQRGFSWWRGYHFRLSKDGKKAIRLDLYHRKQFLEMRTVDDLIIRDLQDKLRLLKKKG